MINIISSSRYKINRRKIKSHVQEFLSQNGLAEDSTINIAFVGRNKMKSLSQTYKKENAALPVLSFPIKERGEKEHLIGEVLICYPQLILLAAEREKRVDDIILELVEHGVGNLIK